MKFEQTNVYKKIFTFHETILDRLVSRESSWLEFKESFNWNSRDKYARTMAAFSNNKGGYLVFGVKNNPRILVGLKTDNFENIDEEKITEYINENLSPEIKFEKFVVKVKTKTIGVIYTEKSSSKPVICTKNNGQLKAGDIYYRYIARNERIKFPELKEIMEDIRDTERRSWMEHFERISKIGPVNAAVMNMSGGEISGKGGTLVIDKKLVPKLKFIQEGSFKEGGKPVLKLVGDVKPVTVVAGKNGKKSDNNIGIKITDDPNAPAVRLAEEEVLKKNYPLDYDALRKKLATRYKDFKLNPKFHALRKELMKNDKFSRTRYLDPSNPKSSKKIFYSPKIYKEFDKHYKKK